jgi:hypothetical protein
VADNIWQYAIHRKHPEVRIEMDGLYSLQLAQWWRCQDGWQNGKQDAVEVVIDLLLSLRWF